MKTNQQQWGAFVLAVMLSVGSAALVNAERPTMNTKIVSPSSADSLANPYDALHPIKPGKPAPDFEVKNAEGKLFKLSQLRQKKNAVLIFYQGHFCSVCGRQLANLQKHYNDFKQQDAEIIAISADDLTHAEMTQGEKGLAFNVVPDPNKAVIQKFGIANVAKENIAWPSAFIVDKKGIVRYQYADERGHRLHSSDLLPQLSKITGKPAPTLSYEE